MTTLKQLQMDEVPISTGAEAIYQDSKALRKKFTAKSKFGDEYELFTKHPNKLIGVPRALCPTGELPWESEDLFGEDWEDNRSVGDDINFNSTFEPRTDEQARFVKEIVELLQAGENFIGEAPTGFGKTPCSAEVIAQIGKRAIVITTKSDLYDMWIRELPKFLGIKPSEIGFIRGDKYNVRTKKVVVALVHSAAKKDRYPGWIYDYFGLMILDEAHRLGAETFQGVCQQFSAKLRLGLSADPKRIDGKDLVLDAHIGPTRVITHEMPMVPKIIRLRSKWKCPRRYEWDELRQEKVLVRIESRDPKDGMTARLVRSISEDSARNVMMGRLIRASHNKDRRTVFFSDLRDHLEQMALVCQKLGMDKKEFGFYVGGKSEEELEVVGYKKDIFATFKMMGEGTNVPWIDTMVLGTPRANVKQFVGRVCRFEEGKKRPVVWDIRDNDSGTFFGYAKKRYKLYEAMGCEIKDMN